VTVMVDWEDIVSREGPGTWRSIYRLVGNRADADECLQETFVDAVKASRRGPVEKWAGLPRRLGTARRGPTARAEPAAPPRAGE